MNIYVTTSFPFPSSGSNKSDRQEESESRRLRQEESTTRREVAANSATQQRHQSPGNNGDGEQLLPNGWVDYSRQPAEGSDGIYGAQVWLQTEDISAAPEDVFLFRGFQDQRIVIMPSYETVIVRLGINEDQTFPLNDFVTKVLAGLPETE